MSDRKLPILGLTGYWPAGTPGWTLENQQNLRMVASIDQLALASRAVLPAAFDPTKVYLVPAGQPNAGQIAVYDAGWFFMVPEIGWNISVADELDGAGNPSWFNWTGAAWAPGKVTGGGGAPAYDDTAIKARIATNEQDIVALKNPPYQGTLIVPWADSRGAQNWNTNTTPAAPLSRSPLWRMEALTQRVRMNVDYMQAVSGDTIEQLVARISNDLPGNFGTKKPSEVPPSIAWLQIGTNSVNQGTSVAVMMSQIDLILNYLVARGHKVLLLAEWPRGVAGSTDGSLSADNQKLMLAYHNALMKIRRRDVWVVDVWPRTADPASTNGYVLPNMLNPDNLHNSPGIAEITAQEAARIINNEMGLPRMNLTCSSNTDQYDAVLQPAGCLNTNPMLVQGAGGTVGTNATGVCPVGYTLSASAGLSVAGSFVTTTLPDGTQRPAFRMVVTGTATAANAYASLRQSGILPKVAVNDVLDALCEVNVSAAGQQNFSSAGLMIDTGLAATRAHGGLSLTGDNPMPASAVKPYYAVPRAAELPIGATLPASISFEMRAYFTAAAVSGVTVDLLSGSLRKKV